MFNPYQEVSRIFENLFFPKSIIGIWLEFMEERGKVLEEHQNIMMPNFYISPVFDKNELFFIAYQYQSNQSLY